MRYPVARILSGTGLALSVVAPASGAQTGARITPAEWLKAQPAPRFKPGHGLPPLTRFGWVLPLDARIELAERWGYALEFGGYVTHASAAKLADPQSDEAKLAALAAADPRRYPLAVICSRELPANDQVPPETWTRNAEGRLLNGRAQSLDGTEWSKGMDVVYSPVAPDAVWQEAGRLRAEPLRQVRAKCPIAVVLNGGEYGLGVSGFARKVWEQDPAILKAKGDRPWFDFISERKARAELLIADSVRAAVPDRQLYIYYTTSGGTHRNRGPDWGDWAYGYEWMKPVSDLASSEHYYRHFNSGWTGGDDLLTQALNAKGFEIANGQPLSYDWLCAGWPREKGLGSGAADLLGDGGLGDLERYTGLLKCLYIAGMVGGNAGYYAYPPGGFAAEFAADAPPHWLRQMVVLAQVHALFSHLEPFLRQGDLLPGPDKHLWSKDQPAYEFPAGTPGVRVLARRLRDKPEWLIVAWAADGTERDVTVTLPEFGETTLRARRSGTLCHAVLRDGVRSLQSADANAGPPAEVRP